MTPETTEYPNCRELLIRPGIMTIEGAQDSAHDQRPAREIMQEALSDFQAERYAWSAMKFERVLLKEPQNAHAYYLLGASFLRLGRIEEAVTCIEAATRLQPNDLTFFMTLGKLQAKLDPTAALETFRRAVSIHKDNAEAWGFYAAQLKRQGSIADALNGFATAARLDPNYFASHAEHAKVYQECLELRDLLS